LSSFWSGYEKNKPPKPIFGTELWPASVSVTLAILPVFFSFGIAIIDTHTHIGNLVPLHPYIPGSPTAMS
jgi:hypothetical protein